MYKEVLLLALPEAETLEEIEQYILRRLPKVLEEDPDFATFIEGLLAEKFPRRDEFARLLDELSAHRKETKEEFVRVNDELVEHRQETKQGFASLRSELTEHRNETKERFEQVDQRFEQVDQRFEQVDQRFEQVDQRFEQVDQRFDRVDQRFDRVDQQFGDLTRQLDRLGGRWGIRNETLFRQTMRQLLEDSFGVKVEERHIAGEQFDCIISNGDHILIEITASAGPKISERLERKRQLYIDETGITPTRFILAVSSIHSRRAEILREAGFEVIEPEEEVYE